MIVQDFYSKLLSKTTELHPSLAEEDLKPYLLHSRAASAYDAVTLLAQSVGVAFDLGGDSCIDTSVIQVLLDQGFLVPSYEYMACVMVLTIAKFNYTGL